LRGSGKNLPEKLSGDLGDGTRKQLLKYACFCDFVRIFYILTVLAPRHLMAIPNQNSALQPSSGMAWNLLNTFTGSIGLSSLRE
jgi:hypothetical protein